MAQQTSSKKLDTYLRPWLPLISLKESHKDPFAKQGNGRNLALRKLKVWAIMVVLAVLSHLQTLGVKPADIEPWTAMCQHPAAEETNAQAFVRPVLALKQVQQRTGLSFEALDEKVQKLKDDVSRLESLVRELQLFASLEPSEIQ